VKLALAGVTFVFVALLAHDVHTQERPPAAATAKSEDGIPIADQTVRQACGSCHRLDDKGQMSRISFQRNTPEGWQTVIQRMASLNGLQIDPVTARQVVKYLSNNLGLAPEEARPAAFEVERRLIDYKYTADADTESVCTKCHSMGRVISQRRTRGEWDLLIAMHRGWYPLVDFQAFRRTGPVPRDRGPDGRPPDLRQPVEKAVDHLAQAFPLKTREWSAWAATMRPARIEGTWSLMGSEPGKGAIYGKVTIARDGNAPDEFTTTMSYTFARTGESVTRTGRGIVYTGYQWRGRSTQGADDSTSLREVLWVDRDWRNMSGRWFAGGYDELGMDVFLQRNGGDLRILGTDKTSLRAGVNGQEVKVYGLNIPQALRPADVDLGPGMAVTRVVSVSPELATVVVDVAQNAAVGLRDLFVTGAAPRIGALVVYERVDSIKVKPDWAMARIGGNTFPKMLAQFEAWAYQNGPDGKPDTADDIEIGPVDASWSLEEYAATYDDDDIKFVGRINEATGRFTPNIEGPNPDRKGSRNNVGDVWVVAKYVADGASGTPATTLRARAHLLVTVPLYMRFDPTVPQ
jgi:quinohemoprotein amine dehydrogenase